MTDPVVHRFHNDDAGFRRWRKGHSSGFVFNAFGGSNPRENVLHRADCDSLLPRVAGQAWTSVPKLCGAARDTLEAALDDLRGGRDRWTYCDACFRM